MRKFGLLLASLGALACALTATAFADDNPLGYYIGAGVGTTDVHQSFVADAAADSGVYDYDDHRLGWKVLMGIRPIPFIGAELEYLDFGSTHIGAGPLVVSAGGSTTTGEFTGADAHASAGAGFVLGYLPLPVPWLDVFGKLGVARLQEHDTYGGDFPVTLTSCTTSCTVLQPGSFSINRVDTGLGYGAGAQASFGAFAVRAELERLQTGIDNPYLLSVGFTWSPWR